MEALEYRIIEEDKHTFTLLQFFLILSAYTFVSYMFIGISRVEPKLLHYILGTLTDHSLSGPQKDHSLLASHLV